MPRAAMAVDAPVEEVAGEYRLEGGAGCLKAKTSGGAPGSPAFVELEVTSSNVSSLILHWGATKPGKGKWYLPTRRPADSWDFHNQAIQSRFVNDGDRAVVRVDFEDAAFNAIEFLLKEDNRDRWFKNNGGNFRVELPEPSFNVTIPGDLIGIQVYLRWEKNGKQMYSPQQEKENFEAARKDLQWEVAAGGSIDALRKKLTGEGHGSATGSASLKSKNDKSTQKFKLSKVTRKKRDPLELLNRADESFLEAVQGGKPPPPREPTPLEAAAKCIEEAEEGFIILRKTFKLGPSDLLVLVTNPDGELKNNAREWMAPAQKVVPKGSVLAEGFAETPFQDGFAGDASLQSLEISLGDSDYIGMPFLFKVGEDWWKDNGGDYYLLVLVKLRFLIGNWQALADGRGTAKAFLEDVANQEKEAERSLMHRYNITTGFAQRAKNEGELAFGRYSCLVAIHGYQATDMESKLQCQAKRNQCCPGEFDGSSTVYLS
ncbi:unnamed protein product [Calypogeia fissa]